MEAQHAIKLLILAISTTTLKSVCCQDKEVGEEDENMKNNIEQNYINEKISSSIDGVTTINNLNKYIPTKGLMVKICARLLSNDPGLYILPFSEGAKEVLTLIVDDLDKEVANWDTSIIREIRRQLSIIPDYIVEMVEDIYTLSKQYYLRIEFFNCPTEEIKIPNEVLQRIKKFYPHTRLLIVTPYDNVFYSVDVNEIKADENLNLKNHTLEEMYPIFTELYDDCEEDIRSILLNYKSLIKDLFGIFDWPSETEN